MLTSTFNSKSTELENKIKDADIIAKSAVTKANSIKSNLNNYAKKTDVANDITTIKNDYVSNASLTSRDSDMDAVSVATTSLPPLIDNGRMSVRLEGAYFKQMRLLRPNNDDFVNIYIVYLIDPISSFRNTDYTVQNALFGGVKITKNATDTSKHIYEGYGICFDEGGMFSMGNINDGRNVLIFGVHESSLAHKNDKANNIFIMGNGFVQGINDTTLYDEKLDSQNFTAVNKKFVLSLHYNGDDSYLFINGNQR